MNETLYPDTQGKFWLRWQMEGGSAWFHECLWATDLEAAKIEAIRFLGESVKLKVDSKTRHEFEQAQRGLIVARKLRVGKIVK